VGLGDDKLLDPRVERPYRGGLEQCLRVGAAQAGHRELRQPDQFRAGHADRDDQRDPVGQAPRDEAEEARGGGVQALVVVDEADDGLLSGFFRQES
jgi:hypothetical protein